MFYNPFLQFNMNSMFSLGYGIGQWCNTALFGPPPTLYNNYFCMTAPFCQQNMFMNNNYFNTGGLDTFTCSSGKMFNSGGLNYNAMNLSCGCNITPSINVGSSGCGFYQNQVNWYTCCSAKFANNLIKRKPVYSPNISNSNVKNLQWWKTQGYNEERGLAFAKVSKEVSDQMYADGAVSDCGGGVRRSVNRYFYNGQNHYTGGWNAGIVGDTYLVNDNNFRKITIPEDMHLSADDIPAGAIIIYHKKYSSSAASAQWGHIEISGGNGHGYSDLTTHLLSNNGVRKEPKEIWIPV